MGIFHQSRFDEQLAELSSDLASLHAALRYVEYQVSEFPESGVETVVPGIFRVRARLPCDGEMVHVAIFYTYDGSDSTFQRIVRDPHA